jgi:hypothetical protein
MMLAVLLLVPSDPLTPRRADEHFAAEADAARDLGVEVALVDHDALCRPGEAGAAVRRVPPADDAVYRGWMLSSSRYAAFAEALAARGTTVRTSPGAYRAAHELPGWYDLVREHTPRSVWTDGPSLAGLAAALAELAAGGARAAVLRDHVKSAKHDWHEAAYIPDITDTAHAEKVGRRLLELRGDDFTGGFVARAYEDLTGPEVRTWWIDGTCRLATAHPDTPEAGPAPGAVDPGPYAAGVAALGAPFVTVDLVLRADGAWRIVEIGDGQVSDRPTTFPAATLVAALAGRATEEEEEESWRP